MRLLVAAGLLMAVILPAIALHDPARAPVREAPATVAAHGRITYPAGRMPTLAMPDGQRRPIRSLLDIDRPMHFGDFVWNEEGVPPGPIWIRVDLARQTLSVFRGEHEIASTLVLYGADGKPTPPGTYPILEKAAHHQSSLYEAEMPYMLRLTSDGIAIHASDVQAAAATHGCIGVPYSFARRLFEAVRRGDTVAIVAPSSPPRRPIVANDPVT